MTKTKLRTPNGKWFKGFSFYFNGNQFEGADIKLSENESDAVICGKTEAKEKIKTAKIHCGVELIEVY